jgi:hypothetical protein
MGNACCRSLSGAQPSGAFFAQLSRYTDERDVARDLLNQHSAWLNTFRSQMNLNGTTMVMNADVRCWGFVA